MSDNNRFKVPSKKGAVAFAGSVYVVALVLNLAPQIIHGHVADWRVVVGAIILLLLPAVVAGLAFWLGLGLGQRGATTRMSITMGSTAYILVFNLFHITGLSHYPLLTNFGLLAALSFFLGLRFPQGTVRKLP